MAVSVLLGSESILVTLKPIAELTNRLNNQNKPSPVKPYKTLLNPNINPLVWYILTFFSYFVNILNKEFFLLSIVLVRGILGKILMRRTHVCEKDQ